MLVFGAPPAQLTYPVVWLISLATRPRTSRDSCRPRSPNSIDQAERGPVLIVISGPIASGKSTVARALARELERQGAPAAAIDLDLIYEMLEHNNARKDNAAKWRTTRRAAAALATGFILAGLDAVIVEGDLLALADRADFLAAVKPAHELRFVTLRTSFDNALRRVADDATRTFSRDPAFLRRHYEAADTALSEPPPTDLVLDTTSIGVDEAVRTIAAWALGNPSAA